MNFYYTKKTLPNYVSVKPISLKVVSSDPAPNATEVSITSPLSISFSNNILAGVNYSGIYIKNLNTGSNVTIASKTIANNILTIKTNKLVNNNTYQVYIPVSAVKDSVGNNLNTAYTFTFTTIAGDTAPPNVISTNPVSNATGVALNSPLIITLSENILAGTNYSGIYIKNTVSGVKVSISSKTINGNTLTIIETSPRKYNTKYQVYIPAGAVKDSSGNNLVTAYTYYFTTVAGTTDVTPPTVISTNPVSNATGVSLTSSITIKFSENIVAGTNYSGIYIKNLSTGTVVSIAKSISGNTLTIKQTYSRLSKNRYQVYIPAGAVKDAAGNNLATVYTYTFTTV